MVRGALRGAAPASLGLSQDPATGTPSCGRGRHSSNGLSEGPDQRFAEFGTKTRDLLTIRPITERIVGTKVSSMSIYTHSLATLDGQPLDLEGLRGKAVLVVNVASKCGLTPQYTGLEELQHKYANRGFTVLGVPCNQFGGQEPGTAEEISTFCSSTYGVTFPITEKVDVNGQRKHPLFTELEAKADANGDAGDIQWNFEKFLLSPAGEVVGRFRPTVTPDAEELVSALEAVLPS